MFSAHTQSAEHEDASMDTVDRMLEQEKQTNKTAPWNRIDKQEKNVNAREK